MDATEICTLTEDAVATLLSERQARARAKGKKCRRHAARWAFPGTVELWLPDEEYGERYALATSINLSNKGIGIRADDLLTPGTAVGIAVHEPEVSFHGRAVVRHCTDTGRGSYIVGLQFLFDGERS